jgi:hypothetical protein
MWGKLDTIGAGKILRDRLGVDSTGTSIMKISGFLEKEAESELGLSGVSGRLNTHTCQHSLLDAILVGRAHPVVINLALLATTFLATPCFHSGLLLMICPFALAQMPGLSLLGHKTFPSCIQG